MANLGNVFGFFGEIQSDGQGGIAAKGSSSGTIRRFAQSASGIVAQDTTGTSSGTIRRVESYGVNLSSIQGSSGATIARLNSGIVGLVSLDGESAGSLRRLTGDGAGVVPVSGISGGTIRRFRSKSGVRYNITIKSKPLFVGPERNSFAELFSLIAFCEFYDKNGLDITILRDYKRYYAESDYVADEEVISNQAEAGQPYFRHHIKVVPVAGFYGSFFQYELVKACPTDGEFKFFGVDMPFIPKPQLGSEFLVKTGAINDGW